MLGIVFRAVFLLALLAALGAGVAWLGAAPPPSAPPLSAPPPPGTARPAAAPPGGDAALATPFGDALFRWRCVTGLQDGLSDRADRADWPLERLAALCLCAADRLRQDGPRAIILGAGDVAASLAGAEDRLCRRR